MKNKNLSFMTLFALTAALVGGCSCSDKNNENVSKLVVKIGNKEYSAKDLYNELLSTGTGANEAFAKVLRLVVESSMETTANIKGAVDLEMETFEEEVEADATSNGTSKDDSRKKLLEEKGYSSVDEMRLDLIYEHKLTRITENYWEENKDDYYNDFITSRLPYLVRHVLVKMDDSNANKIANNVAISQSDAKKLFDVIKRFEKGDKFSYVANQESEDTGSTASGGAYYMDNTYGVDGFVDEFVYGTYAFDTYATRKDNEGVISYEYGANQAKLAKLKGLTDTETFSTYYENGFNFVDMASVNMLGEVYNQVTQSDKDYFHINNYDKVQDKTDPTKYTYESSSSSLNSYENYYARSIIFNRVFNKPGVSVIGYNTKQETIDAGAKNYVELKMSQTESKFILTDENKNPIFFVAARGSNSDIWVHFLTINVSSLDNIENAKKFFALGEDEDDTYTNYVELKNTAGTTQGANTVIKELEGYIKSYVTDGVGDSEGEASLLNYDMVAHYMSKNNIKYLNDDLKSAIESYISNKRSYLRTKLLNSISDDWDTHTDKLKTSTSQLVQKGVKPFECAVLVDSDVSIRNNPYTALNTDQNLCRYVYGEGYQVQLSYYYETTSSNSSNESFVKVNTSNNNRVYFVESSDPTEDSGYVQYVTIGSEGSERIKLPTPKVSEGYRFDGWFTNKDLTEEVSYTQTGPSDPKVYYVDLSESRMTNKTIFFAKVTNINATTINYTYEYADGTAVDEDVVSKIVNNNITTKTYNSSGNENTITFSLDSINGTAANPVTATKFLNSEGTEITNLTLVEADKGQTKTIRVVVSAKATTINYKYVTSDGTDAPHNADTNTNSTSATYGTGNNEVTLSTSNFTWSNGLYEAVSFKIARDDETFANATATSLTLTEQDMGKTVTVYVVVGEVSE